MRDYNKIEAYMLECMRDSAHVRDCVYTHRFRSGNPPQSIEAKILFDADKIDVSGAVGMARSLMYHGAVGEPLYTINADGTVNDGSDTDEPSFFREYHFKLKKIYEKFFTERGKQIALGRQRAAEEFYNALLSEVKGSEERARELLQKIKRCPE